MNDANEELGQLIDRLDSASTFVINGTMLPDATHLEAMRALLPEIVTEMKAAFVKVTGENPWD